MKNSKDISLINQYVERYNSGVYNVEKIINKYRLFLENNNHSYIIKNSSYLDIIKASLLLENMKMSFIMNENRKICYLNSKNDYGSFSTGIIVVDKNIDVSDIEKEFPKWSRRYNDIEFFNSINELKDIKKEQIELDVIKVLEQSISAKIVPNGLSLELFTDFIKYDKKILKINLNGYHKDLKLFEESDFLYLALRGAYINLLPKNKPTKDLKDGSLIIFNNSKKLLTKESLDSFMDLEGNVMSKAKNLVLSLFINNPSVIKKSETFIRNLEDIKGDFNLEHELYTFEFILKKILNSLDKNHLEEINNIYPEIIINYIEHIHEHKCIDLSDVNILTETNEQVLVLNIDLNKSLKDLSVFKKNIFINSLSKKLIIALQKDILFNDKKLKSKFFVDEKYLQNETFGHFIKYVDDFGDFFKINIKVENNYDNIIIFKNYIHDIISEVVVDFNDLFFNDEEFLRRLDHSYLEINKPVANDANLALNYTRILRETTLAHKMDKSSSKEDKIALKRRKL